MKGIFSTTKRKMVLTIIVSLFVMVSATVVGFALRGNKAVDKNVLNVENGEGIIISNESTSTKSPTKSSTKAPLNSSLPEETKAPEATKNSQSEIDMQNNSNKKHLGNMWTSATHGTIINCEFSVGSTNMQSVEEKWGKPDILNWVAAAKGTYATYSKYDMVFGFNKGAQIFEIRNIGNRVSSISLSIVKESFGKPAYDVKSNGEEIIGYVVTKEYKMLLVFPADGKGDKNTFMKHYSVLYPAGTVNSMANDPGREW